MTTWQSSRAWHTHAYARHWSTLPTSLACLLHWRTRRFPYRNVTMMQFGTALLNVSGQCCYEGFESRNATSRNATSDFAGFDCSVFADALCGHPAYGQWMNAVCPQSCNACMDQLWTEVTDDTPQYPAIPQLCVRSLVSLLYARSRSVFWSLTGLAQTLAPIVLP